LVLPDKNGYFHMTLPNSRELVKVTGGEDIDLIRLIFLIFFYGYSIGDQQVKYIQLCISISVLLLSSAFSTTKAIELSLNQSPFSSGDTLVLTLNENWSGEADVYVAVTLPEDDRFFFLTPSGFVLDLTPYAQTVQARGLKEIFRLVLPELPGGEYTFYAMLILPNTLQFISEIVKVSLVFQAQSQVTPGEVFRDRLQDGSLGPSMVWIPAGTFRMGDIQGGGWDDERPVHEVSVSRFAMGRYEVTFAEYDKFAEATGREKPNERGWGRGNRPVIYISWHDAVAYAEWLSGQTGHSYRLPTEAEWEYAARAGTETKYWWGKTASHEYANYGQDGCCAGKAEGRDQWVYTAPVGSLEANPFGIYDTAGNVWEWVHDVYSYDSYSNSPSHDPSGPSTGSNRVFRGGGWSAPDCRAAYRNNGSPGYRYIALGFRLLRQP